jgi:hypothetical protein
MRKNSRNPLYGGNYNDYWPPEHAQSCSNMLKHAQTCSNMFTNAQKCSEMLRHSIGSLGENMKKWARKGWECQYRWANRGENDRKGPMGQCGKCSNMLKTCSNMLKKSVRSLGEDIKTWANRCGNDRIGGQ